MAGKRAQQLSVVHRRTTDDPTLAFGFTDAQGKLSYDLNRKHSVSLSIVEGISDLDRTKARDELGLNSLMLAGYHLTLANLGWRYTPGESFLIASRVAYMRERYNNRNREELDLARGYYGEWIWGERNTLDAGWSLRSIRDDGFDNRYQLRPFAVRRLDEWAGNGLRAGGFAQQSWSTANGRVRLSAGLRWDWHEMDAVEAVSPHAATALVPHPKTHIRLGWGQYAQYPELQFLFSRFGSAGLAPERANHFTASIEQRLDERTRLRAEFYNREDRDLLFRPFYEPRLIEGKVFKPPEDSRILNSVRGYARGLEIFLQRRTANRLTGWVSYAYGRTRMRDGEANITFPSDTDQRHTVNVHGSYRIRPAVSLSLKYVRGSGFPIPGFYRRQGQKYYLSQFRNALRVDSYHPVDVRINKAFVFDRWKLTLYAEVINLLNRANYRFDTLRCYNSNNRRAYPRFDKMFPILPSARVVPEFGGGGRLRSLAAPAPNVMAVEAGLGGRPVQMRAASLFLLRHGPAAGLLKALEGFGDFLALLDIESPVLHQLSSQRVPGLGKLRHATAQLFLVGSLHPELACLTASVIELDFPEFPLDLVDEAPVGAYAQRELLGGRSRSHQKENRAILR